MVLSHYKHYKGNINMNKENQFKQFKNMVSDKLENIKEQSYSNDDFDVDIFGCIVELTSMIFATTRLT